VPADELRQVNDDYAEAETRLRCLVAELARKYDVDRPYVGRILKLTSLAPDIVEVILAGRRNSQPRDGGRY